MALRLPALAIALGFLLELSCLLALEPAAAAGELQAEEGRCESSPALPPGEAALLQVGTAPAKMPSFAGPLPGQRGVLPFVSSTEDPLAELHDEFDDTTPEEVQQTIAAATAALTAAAAVSTSSPALAAAQGWAFDQGLHTVLYLCQDAMILAAFVGGAFFVRVLRGKHEALREAAAAEEALRRRTLTTARVVEAAARQEERNCVGQETFRQHWEEMVAAARAPA